MGQALLQKTQLSEATEYLELAISKVWYLLNYLSLLDAQMYLVGFCLAQFFTSFCSFSQLLDEAASDAEDVELLMLASQWAGAAYVQQVLIEQSWISYDSFSCYVPLVSNLSGFLGKFEKRNHTFGKSGETERTRWC